MPRAISSHTFMTRRISKIDLHNLICAHPAKFRLGGRFTSTWLCTKLGFIQPSFKGLSTESALKTANTFNLVRMSAYVRLNRQLALRGLVIRQATDPITSKVEYIVQEIEGTEERLEAYATKMREGQQQFQRLSNGVRRYQSTWSRLRDSELEACY